MLKPYTAAAWYWIVAGDESQVYSSAKPGFVPSTDPVYIAWIESGGRPTCITSLDELRDVFMRQYVPGWALTLTEQMATSLAAIDHEAGRARARYITVAPGQEATYILKAQQAAAFKAGGYTGPVPGLVRAEMDATGAAAQAATDDILAQEAAWAAKAAQIESARRRGKVAVASAIDAAGVDAARLAAITELEAL